jgi:Amt family ammonium transporter
MEGAYSHYIYATTDEKVSAVWIMTSGIFIFFMEAGFFMLEAGSQRKKNVGMIMIMNLMSAAVGMIMWWFTGYAFGFSHNPTGFIG